MSFAERVKQKRLERAQEAARQWEALVDAAAAPEMVAKMAGYEAVLRGLASDFAASSEFAAVFGDTAPAVSVSLPGETFRGIIIDTNGIQEGTNETGRSVSMTCGELPQANGSMADYQMDARLQPSDDGVACHVRIVQYDETGTMRMNGYRAVDPASISPQSLENGLWFSKVRSDQFTAASPSDLAEKLGDYLAEFVSDHAPEFPALAHAGADTASVARSRDPADDDSFGQPGFLGRLFRR